MDRAQELGHFARYVLRSVNFQISLEEHGVSGVSSRRNRFDKSEISLATKQACRIGNESTGQNVSISSMIYKRELGSKFSAAQRCQISSNYLPNSMQKVANYDSPAFCGSYSADGKYFLTACLDGTFRLYRTHNGEFREYKKVLARHRGSYILDTAFSLDGNYVAYSHYSGSVDVYPIYGYTNTQGTIFFSVFQRRFCIKSLAFSSDGKEVLGGGNDGFLYMYNRECQKRVLGIEAHNNDVNSVAFADNTAQVLYSAGDDGLCKVWDRRMLSEGDSHPVGILSGHWLGILYIDRRGDGRHLLTNSKDETIKLWDVRAFSDQSRILNCNWQTVQRIFERSKYMRVDTSIMTYRGHSVSRASIRCHFSPAATTGQRYIYTGCTSGRVVIYDVLTGDIVKSLHGHRRCVRDVSWHPSCQEIILTSWDGIIGRWRYADKAASDSKEDSNTKAGQLRTLRRSQRIAAQKAKESTSR